MNATTTLRTIPCAHHLPETVVVTLERITHDGRGQAWFRLVGGPRMCKIKSEGALYQGAWRVARTHPGLFGFALARIWDVMSYTGPADLAHPFVYRTDAQMNKADHALMDGVIEASEGFLSDLDDHHGAYAQRFGELFGGAPRSHIERLVWQAPTEFSRGAALGSLVLSYWREEPTPRCS